MKGRIDVEDPATAAPSATPAVLRLHGVEPNPFNPRTAISFTLGETSVVTVQVHDARGRLVRTVVSGAELGPGRRSVLWDGTGDDGSSVASGVYFFAVRVRGYEQTVRGTLVR